MKKLFTIFTLAVLGFIAVPSCSTSDSFEDVVMEAEINVEAPNNDNNGGNSGSNPSSGDGD